MKRKYRPWKKWQRALCWLYTRAAGRNMCRSWRARLRGSETPGAFLLAAFNGYEVSTVTRLLTETFEQPTGDAHRVLCRIAHWHRDPNLICQRAGAMGWDGSLPK